MELLLIFLGGVVVVIGWLTLTAPPASSLPLDELRARSIRPSNPDEDQILELVLDAVHEPVLSIETREQVESAEMVRLDPDSGAKIRIFEPFPHDLRVRTGTLWGPKAGRGHFVSLDKIGGQWVIADQGEWIA